MWIWSGTRGEELMLEFWVLMYGPSLVKDEAVNQRGCTWLCSGNGSRLARKEWKVGVQDGFQTSPVPTGNLLAARPNNHAYSVLHIYFAGPWHAPFGGPQNSSSHTNTVPPQHQGSSWEHQPKLRAQGKRSCFTASWLPRTRRHTCRKTPSVLQLNQPWSLGQLDSQSLQFKILLRSRMSQAGESSRGVEG